MFQVVSWIGLEVNESEIHNVMCFAVKCEQKRYQQSHVTGCRLDISMFLPLYADSVDDRSILKDHVTLSTASLLIMMYSQSIEKG